MVGSNPRVAVFKCSVTQDFVGQVEMFESSLLLLGKRGIFAGLPSESVAVIVVLAEKWIFI